MLAAVALLAAQEAERVKPLEARSLWFVLGGIALIMFAIVLAGLGYFSFNNSAEK